MWRFLKRSRIMATLTINKFCSAKNLFWRVKFPRVRGLSESCDSEGSMVKKLKVEADEKQYSFFAIEYARKIWLAGLGAFARAETEGGKLFEFLVAEGEQFEGNTRKIASDRIEEIVGRLEQAKSIASGTWEKLEDVFEQRLAQALNRMGVPTTKDIEDLASRVEALNESIKALQKH
ncbi:MAG: phasin family protein [Candidatus Competibacteraceae bacterium]